MVIKILIAEMFLDDIIFGAHEMLCKSFAKEMRKEFEMSMIGEINLFVGLQVHEIRDRIFIT